MNRPSPIFEKAINFSNTTIDKSKVIFHIDVNSAYLSWTAAYLLSKGDPCDLRQIPAVIGGDELSRHGIVLAKSIPAKKLGIKTGNPLHMALEKCPELKIVSPDYYLYNKASKAMIELIREYSPKVQQFSVDECFVDFKSKNQLFGDPLTLATTISKRIKDELGFTVNIGISTNKLLAKMASEFEKPDKIHTLFPDEIAYKMWPLPVSELFMVGRKTTEKLHAYGIFTIHDLANASPAFLESNFKSFGITLYSYANGLDISPVRKSNFEVVKGMGNSTTAPFDILKKEDAYKVLLSLCETVGARLRQGDFMANLIAVSIVTTKFTGGSHQKMIDMPTNSTNHIYEIARQLFDELWGTEQESLRKFGVRVSKLQSGGYFQESLLQEYDFEKESILDCCVDTLRSRYRSNIIHRASFLKSGLKPVNGGIGEAGYPVMTCKL